MMTALRRIWQRLRRPLVERIEYADPHHDVMIFLVGGKVVEIPATAIVEERHRTPRQMAWEYALDGRARDVLFHEALVWMLMRNQGRLVSSVLSTNALMDPPA